MQHKHSLKKYFIPSLLFLGGAALGIGVIVYFTNVFSIKSVEIFGVNKEERVIIQKLLASKSILTTQPELIKKLIGNRFPTMNVKEVQLVFPSTVILSVEKEKPFAFLQSDYGYFILSKKGTVLKKERSFDIPTPSISFYQILHHAAYQVGQNIGYSQIKRTLGFITLLMDEGYAVETVAIDSVDMIACKTKGFEVAFSQTRPIELQQHEVRQIVRQIKAGALRIERLDLRFDKPVVQLPPK